MASRVESGVEDRPGGRLTDHIGLGVLSARFGRDLLEEVVNDTGVREKRKRLLPAHVMIRYVIAMGLFFEDSYEEVMRRLVGSLKRLGSWADDWQVPTGSAICQARQRLGVAPLEELFDRAAVPVAHSGTKPSGSFAANAAWNILAAICHNLLRAAGTLTHTARYTVARGATLRTHLVNIPARLARPQRRPVLHLPAHWPRATAWLHLWKAVFIT